MDLQISNLSGELSDESVSLADSAFARDYNEALIHQVVTAYMATGRSGTKAQKRRSDVSGGGIKPWRQKGTGRARAGTSRSPIWRGGGVTFAAVPRSYEQKVNRKMFRAAMQSILSELVRQQRLVVVNEFTLEAPKTKLFVAKMRELGLASALIITAEFDDRLFLAARNVMHTDVITSDQIDPVTLIAYPHVVITVDALKQLEETYA
ncbi:MAG: 50S ribosomal protein L4 [Gammaproteobacteria bacterium]|nr:50S ribosomal protein L4 [Gammaproteobacteria bacterium]